MSRILKGNHQDFPFRITETFLENQHLLDMHVHHSLTPSITVLHPAFSIYIVVTQKKKKYTITYLTDKQLNNQQT